jgi:predicted nuclease of predicted toxin-antitoxin system
VRVLLDENVPVQLKTALAPHLVRSVNDKDVGWKNIKNGVLLDLMDGAFDLLTTADRNIYAQQRLVGRSFSILVLPTNRRQQVLALREKIVEIVDDIGVGKYVTLEITGAVHKRSLDQSDDGADGGATM